MQRLIVILILCFAGPALAEDRPPSALRQLADLYYDKRESCRLIRGDLSDLQGSVTRPLAVRDALCEEIVRGAAPNQAFHRCSSDYVRRYEAAYEAYRGCLTDELRLGDGLLAALRTGEVDSSLLRIQVRWPGETAQRPQGLPPAPEIIWPGYR